MDVADLGGGKYELSAVTVHGRTLRGFGPITAETNVRNIVLVCERATAVELHAS